MRRAADLVAGLGIALCSTGICMIVLGYAMMYHVEDTPCPTILKRAEVVHKPSECEYLYNVGRSIEWQECMGVGPK